MFPSVTATHWDSYKSGRSHFNFPRKSQAYLSTFPDSKWRPSKAFEKSRNHSVRWTTRIKYKSRVGDRLTWQLSKDHLFRLNLCIKSALILHLFAKKVSWRSLAPNQFDQPTCRNQMLLYAAQTSGFSDKLSWPTLKTSFTLRPQDSTFHSSSKTTM